MPAPWSIQQTVMEESLEAFLSCLNLSQYLDNFSEAGYDDRETVITLSEEELENQIRIVLPGHKWKLYLNFTKLRNPTAKVSTSKNEPQKGKQVLQTKLTFQSGNLSVQLPQAIPTC